jgi:hypothetical protein
MCASDVCLTQGYVPSVSQVCPKGKRSIAISVAQCMHRLLTLQLHLSGLLQVYNDARGSYRAAQAVGVLTIIGLAIYSFSNPLAFYWVVLVLALQRGPILPCQVRHCALRIRCTTVWQFAELHDACSTVFVQALLAMQHDLCCHARCGTAHDARDCTAVCMHAALCLFMLCWRCSTT